MATRLTVLPDTVQMLGLSEAKLTARPELEQALTANGAAPRVWPESAPKVMVCACCVGAVIWKVSSTGVAAAYSPLPACVTSMVHWPTATTVRMFPDMVHTGFVREAILTGKPELAMAMMVSGPTPSISTDMSASVQRLAGPDCLLLGPKTA